MTAAPKLPCPRSGAAILDALRALGWPVDLARRVVSDPTSPGHTYRLDCDVSLAQAHARACGDHAAYVLACMPSDREAEHATERERRAAAEATGDEDGASWW